MADGREVQFDATVATVADRIAQEVGAAANAAAATTFIIDFLLLLVAHHSAGWRADRTAVASNPEESNRALALPGDHLAEC